jgi:DNA-binding transcriptional regulator WhiA
VTAGEIKDALARDVPDCSRCRAALRDALALYGSHDGGRFVAHRSSVARLFWSLLGDERKEHRIERLPASSLGLPAFAIDAPHQTKGVPMPVRRCERAAEIRGAFLACGTLAAAGRGYHLEFALDPERAARLARLLQPYASPKTGRRKRRTTLYYKDSEAIARLLAAIGAHAAVLDLEDLRALRETKNRVHRLVNSEVANLQRSAAASAAQSESVRFLEDAVGLETLSGPLREMAELRLAHPDESLAELGRRCKPPIGKPAASGRLASLRRLAERVRAGQGPVKQAR